MTCCQQRNPQFIPTGSSGRTVRRRATTKVHNALDATALTRESSGMPETCFTTSIGSCAIAWEADEITTFRLPPAGERAAPPPPWVNAIIARVQRHLAGDPQEFADVPFAWHRVSAFQRTVYEMALRVKPGQTMSYGQLATAVGSPATPRAVGNALGQNPWPLLVPCHRFIGADGRMTGFSAPGGIKTKLRLLVLEGAELFAE